MIQLSKDESSFTISDANAVFAVTKFLIQHKFAPANSWREKNLVYHFDIAVTPGEKAESFVWNTSRLERVCLFLSSRFSVAISNGGS